MASRNSWNILIGVCRLCHKDYDVSLDYGAHYGFHFVYGNDLNRYKNSGCDAKLSGWLL